MALISLALAFPTLLAPHASRAAAPYDVRVCDSSDVIHDLGHSLYSVEPRAGFNPLAASKTELNCYGLPADTAFLKGWHYMVPVMGPPKPARAGGQVVAYNSTNWGGWGLSVDNNHCVGNPICTSSFSKIWSNYDVPTMHAEPFRQTMVFWVGLGGDTIEEPTSTNIWQGGVARDVSPSGASQPYFWLENVGCNPNNNPSNTCPQNITPINTVAVNPNDPVYTLVTYSGGPVCEIQVSDANTHQSADIQDTNCTVYHIDWTAEAINETASMASGTCGNTGYVVCGYPYFSVVHWNNLYVTHDWQAGYFPLCQYSDTRFNLVNAQGTPQSTTYGLNCGSSSLDAFGYLDQSNNP